MISDGKEVFYRMQFPGLRVFKITSIGTIPAHLIFNGIRDSQEIQEEKEKEGQ